MYLIGSLVRKDIYILTQTFGICKQSILKHLSSKTFVSVKREFPEENPARRHRPVMKRSNLCEEEYKEKSLVLERREFFKTYFFSFTEIQKEHSRKKIFGKKPFLRAGREKNVLCDMKGENIQTKTNKQETKIVQSELCSICFFLKPVSCRQEVTAVWRCT